MKLKNTLIYSLIILTAFALITSCGESQKADETETTNEPQEPTCTYTLDRSSTSLNWTAYKFEARTEVKGVMEEVELSGGNPTAENPSGMLENLSFSISSNSVNSNDTLRDYKLREIFLGSMTSTDQIKGEITGLKGAETKGVVTLNLTMNGQQKPVEGKYEITENEVKLYADVNFEDWQAHESLDSLREACAEKHTGADGVTKMWSDIKVIVIANYTKECE